MNQIPGIYTLVPLNLNTFNILVVSGGGCFFFFLIFGFFFLIFFSLANEATKEQKLTDS